MKNIVALTLLLSLVACSQTMPDDPQPMSSPEEAIATIDDVLTKQVPHFRPIDHKVSHYGFAYLARGGNRKEVWFGEIAEQKLVLKNGTYRVHLLDNEDDLIFIFATAHEPVASEYSSAIYTLREYVDSLPEEERGAMHTITLDLESGENATPAWNGVRVVPFENIVNCRVVAEGETCGTGIGAEERCNKWHTKRAEKMGANAIVLGEGRKQFNPFGLTKTGFYQDGDYYWCNKMSQEKLAKPKAPVASAAIEEQEE